MKKYTDVDIVAELQKLVDSHVDSYKEDFDIDKRIIRRAAESHQAVQTTKRHHLPQQLKQLLNNLPHLLQRKLSMTLLSLK